MSTLGGFAHKVLELCKDLFDWVQVWRIWRQEKELGSDAADGLAHGGPFMAAQIIHDDDIARRERGQEALLDIIGKTLSVDWLIEHAGCVDPVASQGGEKRHCAPMTVRHFGMKPLSLGRPAT